MKRELEVEALVLLEGITSDVASFYVWYYLERVLGSREGVLFAVVDSQHVCQADGERGSSRKPLVALERVEVQSLGTRGTLKLQLSRVLLAWCLCVCESEYM